MGIGKRIKEARNALNMTQEDLAKLLGITKGAVANYENETSHPKEPIMYKMFDALRVDANYLFQDVTNIPQKKNDVTLSEYNHIQRYRDLDDHGKESVDFILNKETKRVELLSAKDARIAELEAAGQTSVTKQIISLIDFQPHTDGTSRMVEYFRSASAGDGVFIMGNEGTEQVAIPHVPLEAREADYAIKISGISMEPDYHDGEVALVVHASEMHYGDVGIFIINGNAYIKEYGREELISRNPESPNIKIAEHDNIVCMGKVVGKIREDEMVRV